MEVHFTPEQEAEIAEVAASAGTDPEALVKHATMRLLEEDPRRAEFIEGNKMDAAVQRILQLQKHVRPDPEGWTIKDYISCGRR
jgi:predicted Ser/Thr protein kinase